MPATPESVIDICAKIVDGARAEIEAMLNSPAARTTRYDRHTRDKLEYAIIWINRVKDRIKGIDTERPQAIVGAPDGERLSEALNILTELRPIILASKGTQWRDSIIQQIDALLPPAER